MNILSIPCLLIQIILYISQLPLYWVSATVFPLLVVFILCTLPIDESVNGFPEIVKSEYPVPDWNTKESTSGLAAVVNTQSVKYNLWSNSSNVDPVLLLFDLAFVCFSFCLL